MSLPELQLELDESEAARIWATVTVAPVWVCQGWVTEPRPSWTRAKRRAHLVGTTYVRARTREGARETARLCGLRGWSRARCIIVRLAHPVDDLGMVPICRSEGCANAGP